MIKLNEKGFNLFTALVAFLLIVLSVLLVNSMISTEGDTVRIITDIQEQKEMQAVADLARADAMQVFNYSIRHTIEGHLIGEDNVFPVSPGQATWEDIIDDFARSNFGGTDGGKQFASRASQQMINLLSKKTGTFGNYKFEVVNIDTVKLGDTLNELFKKSMGEGKFFEVIDCQKGEFKKCLGTFYINLDLTKLSDLEYEGFPQIKVTNIATERTMLEPIMPKGNFRIYVPIRFFKAMAAAHELMHTAEVTNENDKGLFSTRIHNEIEEMKLGLCDPGSCRARTDIFGVTSGGMNFAGCPTAIGFSPVEISAIESTAGYASKGISAGHKYRLGDELGTGKTLSEIVEERVNYITNKIAETKLEEMGGLNIITESDEVFERGKNVIKNVIVNTQPVKSKIITFGSGGTKDGSSGASGWATGSCGWQAGGVGMYLDRGKPKTSAIVDLIIDEVANAPAAATCAEVTTVRAELEFRETNPKYKVVKDNDNIYKIALIDNFYNPFTAKYFAASGGANCALQEEPSPITPDISQWTCISHCTGPSFDDTGAGCMPNACAAP